MTHTAPLTALHVNRLAVAAEENGNSSVESDRNLTLLKAKMTQYQRLFVIIFFTDGHRVLYYYNNGPGRELGIVRKNILPYTG